MVLLLPVATTSVERAFSSMDFVKTKRRNKMSDSFWMIALSCSLRETFWKMWMKIM
jgi:hypothetical protein